MEFIHYKLTYRRDRRKLGSGDSILVLMHVYLTTHYSRRVRDGKLGVGTVSVLCIDVSKTRVHMHLMVLSLGMRSVIYMP